MVRKYEVRGTELGGDAFYEDWVEVVRYEDYAKLKAELQKYKDQFPDYIECANCGSVTHVEGVKHDGKESAWTVWLGGENPVPGKCVDVKFRCGEIAYCENSCLYYWDHDYLTDSDIIAYRVVG